MRKHINKVILIVVNVLITPIHNSCFTSRNLYSALSSVFTNMTHLKGKKNSSNYLQLVVIFYYIVLCSNITNIILNPGQRTCSKFEVGQNNFCVFLKIYTFYKKPEEPVFKKK